MGKIFKILYRSAISLLCITLTLSLLACEKQIVYVNLHGVNYSDNDFTYFVFDLVKADEVSGSENIGRFSAGGTTCCARLPKEWEPGIKLKIRTIHWLKSGENGERQQVKQEHIIEVPPYVGGKPGELWVLRGDDGRISVISSDFQPDHPSWPGKIKGWPIPSLQYEREQWEQVRKQAYDNVGLHISLLNGVIQTPHESAMEAWQFALKYEPESLSRFSGPDDKEYVDDLRRKYTVELEESQARLKEIMEMRP